MIYPFKQPLLLFLPVLGQCAVVTYLVPSSAPKEAAKLDPAPVGISLEFYAFPSYFKDVVSTSQCLQNLQSLTGTWPPIRIGGTTQDRAVFDPALSEEVKYTPAGNAPTTDVPLSLTFGPSFMSLAATYQGSVVVGLNRGHDNISGTIAAAKSAKAQMPNLHAIELGNEPEYFADAKQPVALKVPKWDPATEGASQNDWIQKVGDALGVKNIIQAGNWLKSPPEWGAQTLIATQDATVKSYVKDYAHHNYPGGSVSTLMSHSRTASNVAGFTSDIAAAVSEGKDYVMGETNSVSGGGAAAVSPFFGASLWTMDYALRASAAGIKRMYFHHGTIGNCLYCWWGQISIGAPYYGGYAATAAMAGGASIVALDTGNDAFAVYIVYDAADKPLRAVLYNSVFYDGTGPRDKQTFVLNGLTATSVKGRRLTAANANARSDQGTGGDVSFAGVTFAHGTCVPSGAEVVENVDVMGGQAKLEVAASEALVVNLQ